MVLDSFFDVEEMRQCNLQHRKGGTMAVLIMRMCAEFRYADRKARYRMKEKTKIKKKIPAALAARPPNKQCREESCFRG